MVRGMAAHSAGLTPYEFQFSKLDTSADSTVK